MNASQVLITMSAVCAIDAGGDVARATAGWLCIESVFTLLNNKTRTAVLKKIADAANGGALMESQEWHIFVRRCVESTPSPYDMPIDAPAFIFANAIFYAASVGGKAKEIVEAACAGMSLERSNFEGLLDSGFDYEAEYLEAYVQSSHDPESSTSMFLRAAIKGDDPEMAERVLTQTESPALTLFSASADEELSVLASLHYKDDSLYGMSESLKSAKVLFHKTIKY